MEGNIYLTYLMNGLCAALFSVGLTFKQRKLKAFQVFNMAVLAFIYGFFSYLKHRYSEMTFISFLLILIFMIRVGNKALSFWEILKGAIILYALLLLFFVVVSMIVSTSIICLPVPLPPAYYTLIYNGLRCILIFPFIYLIHWNVGRKFIDEGGIRVISVIFMVTIFAYEMIGAIYDKKLYYIFFLGLGLLLLSAFSIYCWLHEQKYQKELYNQLNSYVHRSKEILPALGDVLQQLKNHSNEEGKSLIQEIEMLYEEQLKSNELENRMVQYIAPTGFNLIDHMLERFSVECHGREIDLDVYNVTSLVEAIQKCGMELHIFARILGDLYRNAFQAVLKSNSPSKHILICFGEANDEVFELSIYDNGVSFPKEVLDNFGKRGVTFGGNGNGLADILEGIAPVEGSFYLVQRRNGEFTKEIHICFDGKGKRVLG